MSIANRYEFMYFIECKDGNPNGDPDMGNTPRMDPQDMRGLISDVAIKRRIRNYIQYAKSNISPYGIIIQQSSNINKFIAQAHEQIGNSKFERTKRKINEAREWLCKNFYDVRTFGAVLSTGANAGQVRGAVQLTFLRSIDPILPLDLSITRMAVTENLKDKDKPATFAQYEEWENSQSDDKLRTMGRKQLIPYGLYVGRGFISANLADDVGFSETDLALFWEALLNMYEHDRSASKGEMSTIAPIIIFKHTGTDSNLEQRKKQSKLGCAPAHKLFELVSIDRISDNAVTRSYKDYSIKINLGDCPDGVEIYSAVPNSSGVGVYQFKANNNNQILSLW